MARVIQIPFSPPWIDAFGCHINKFNNISRSYTNSAKNPLSTLMRIVFFSPLLKKGF